MPGSPSEFLKVVNDLALRLEGMGEPLLARDCREAAHAATTTSSEWLGEIKLALLRAEAVPKVRKDGSLLRDTRRTIRRIELAWNRS